MANIIYWNRDQHGRAMGAEACLRGRVQEMDESTYYTPPGWKPGMDRGHLIARMFGGDNTLPENFVPLYPDANQKTMRAIEDDVARRLNAGERLYYSMKPVYLFHTGNKMYIPQGVNIRVAGADAGRNYYVPNR